MRRRRISRRWIGVSAAALLLLLGRPAEPQELEEPQAELAAEPRPIPAPEVAERADALARRLRQVRERIAPIAEVETIATGLAERLAPIETERQRTLSVIEGQATLAQLSELERDWTRLGSELSAWRRSLTGRAAAIEAEVRQLEATESTWTATLGSTSIGTAPDEVTEAIRRSMSEIREVREAASQRRSEVLTLQNRVALQELVVAESLEAVQGARAVLRNRLFEPDQPPIWSSLGDEQAVAGERIAAAFGASRAAVQGFLEERRARLLAVAVLFVLAWLGALGLKRSIAARRAAGGEIADTSKVFRRPIAVGSLVGLLGIFWLFPLAPGALFNVVGLLLLVPMLRLLPSLMHPGFRPILYGIALFYVSDRLRGVLEGAALEARVAFALECAAAAIFCLVLLRRSRLAKIPEPDRFPRWPGRAVRVGLVLFSAAFLANLLGYVFLARLVGEGTLTSIYIAIALYASVRILGIILDVATKTSWAQQIRFLRARRAVAVGWISWGISVLAGGLWGYWTLGAFAVQDAFIGGVGRLLAAPFTFGSASISLGDLVAFGVTVAAAFVISRVIRFVLMEDVFPRIRTGRGIPHAVSATVQYGILFGGFLLALAAAGIDFSKFTLLAGAFGVGIGFGLQNVVNNFVSGIILLYERPIQVGDTIDMGDLIGTVKRIGIRSSAVRTFSGAEVIVPNADLVSQRVVNWTLSDRTRRIDVSIGVEYGTDPEKVMEILAAIGDAHPHVLKHPAPVTLFRRHGESSLDFELRVWIANFDEWFQVESELNTAINRALAEAGIGIPFPQRDLHLRSVDATAARKLTGEPDAI